MKRFLLFAFSDYYPSGGLSDVDSSHDTLKEALEEANQLSWEFMNVFDCDTRTVVWSKGDPPHSGGK